jgi:hypothetical protein
MAHTTHFDREYEGNSFHSDAGTRIYQTARRHNPEDLSVKVPALRASELLFSAMIITAQHRTELFEFDMHFQIQVQ